MTLKQNPPLEQGLNSQLPDGAGVVVGAGVVDVVVDVVVSGVVVAGVVAAGCVEQ